jgi:hypothetical protein
MQSNDLERPVAIQVRQRDTVWYGQSLGRQVHLSNQLPAPLAIAPEPEEAMSGLDVASDMSPGHEIAMAFLIEIPAGLLKPEQNQVQPPVAIEIGQLGRHISILSPERIR